MSKSKTTIPWEYCECGCKGHTLDVAGIRLWSYMALDDTHGGPFFLKRVHGWYGEDLGKFKTSALQDQFVRSLLRKAVKDLRKIVG